MSNVLFNLANVTLTECETRVDLHNPSDTDGTKRSARTLEARKRYSGQCLRVRVTVPPTLSVATLSRRVHKEGMSTARDRL